MIHFQSSIIHFQSSVIKYKEKLSRRFCFYWTLYAFEFIDINFINFDECQSMARGSEKYVIASIAKTYKIQEEIIADFQILSFTWFCVHWHWFWCLSGLSEAPTGPPGTPREPLGAHLTMFDKYVKKCKNWITSFWGLLDDNCSITHGFIGVLKSQIEA